MNSVRPAMIATACVLALVAPAPAQDPGESSDYMTAFAPGEEHEQLRRLVGEWRVHGRMRFQPTQPWDSLDAKATMDLVLDGMHLYMRLLGQQTETWPKPYRSNRFLSFDTFADRWQMAITDNLGTKILFAQGDAGLEPERIRVEAQLDWPVSEGESLAIGWRGDFFLESDDRFVWREFLRGPGQDEHLGIEAVFTRVPDSVSPILGMWRGVGRGGHAMWFDFRGDSTVAWTVQTPAGEVRYDLDYTLDETQEPHKLDVIGISEGPLAGQTLYGIVDFLGDDAFRFDLEPGEPGSTGQGVRPKGFDPDDTVVFRRVEEPR